MSHACSVGWRPGRVRLLPAGLLCAGLLAAATAVPVLPARAQEPEPEAGERETEQQGIRRRLIDATSQEQEWTPSFRMTPQEELRELVQRADQALAAGRLTGEGGAVALLARALAIDGGNAQAQAAMTRAVTALVREGETALARGRFDEGANLAALAQRHRPDDAGVRALLAKIASGREQAQRLAEAQRRLDAGNLIQPAGQSALDLYREALTVEPGNAAAREGLLAIERALIARAGQAADRDDFAEADRLLAAAATVGSGSTQVQDATVQMMERRQRRAQALTDELLAAIGAGDFDRAEGLFAELERVAVQGSDLDELRRRLDNARNYANHSPGDIIVDTIASGGEGPEMVVIPLGSFEMGSPNREKDRVGNEGPRFMVTFQRGFAMARSEITIGQFQRFVNATGYVTQAQRANRAIVYDESTGTLTEKSGVSWRDNHLGKPAAAELPVINVSWEDAKAYADWLSRETGKGYRLPTEAEFEYALRAGSDTRYPWGDDNPEKVVGNFTGDGDRSESGRSWANAFRRYNDGHWGPAPVRSYPPNAFGLYDMEGNVSEWVEDCWHDSYNRAPTDGSAWVNPGCELRVIRGASWASAPEQVRSAFRLAASAKSVNPRLGFRLVREL